MLRYSAGTPRMNDAISKALPMCSAFPCRHRLRLCRVAALVCQVMQSVRQHQPGASLSYFMFGGLIFINQVCTLPVCPHVLQIHLRFFVEHGSENVEVAQCVTRCRPKPPRCGYLSSRSEVGGRSFPPLRSRCVTPGDGILWVSPSWSIENLTVNKKKKLNNVTMKKQVLQKSSFSWNGVKECWHILKVPLNVNVQLLPASEENFFFRVLCVPAPFFADKVMLCFCACLGLYPTRS